MSQIPIGHRAAMGYALWHLQQGETVAEVRARVENEPRFGFLTPQERIDVVREASRNLRATAAAHGLANNQLIGSVVGGVVPADTPIGVRVVIVINRPGGGTETVSVVVGARAGASVGDILAAAEAHVRSGAMGQRTGRNYGTEIARSEIAQVSIGGYDNPAVGVL